VRIKDYSSTTYVTGMRAFAALAVLLIHSGGGGLRSLGTLGNSLADLGRGGVYAFFVISGFSVAASYGHAGGYGRYLFLRFMRLAPLYYFWLLVYALWLGRSGYWALSTGVLIWPMDIFMHLFFLHAFFVPSANSIIGVEWSLSVEMFWYLWLPGLLWASRKGKAWLLVVLSLGSFFAAHILFDKRAEADSPLKMSLLWDPLMYFFSYVLGVWSFVLRESIPQADRRGGVLLALALLGAYVGAPLWHLAVPVDMVLVVSLITFLFLVYGSNEDFFCRHLFLSRLALVLGTLSYGIYLSHMIVLHFLTGLFSADALGQFLQMLSLVIFSAAAAWMAYWAIEQPSERWAKRFYPLVNKSNF
jgi:peptidoglycan/LPS O-acetylase OafA/YrhL